VGHLHILKLLIQHGVTIYSSYKGGFTLLMQAASTNQPRVAKFLIDKGVSVHAVDSSSTTALHYATLSTKTGTETMRLLLAHGAAAVLNSMQCLNWEDGASVSALLLCIDTAVLKLLLTAGADVHAVTSTGDTCLHAAARYDYPAPVLCLLIKAGADIHAVNTEGKTAAEIAHYSGNTLIEQLLNRAAQQA
jgi:ankyrin repeat protein